MQVTYYNRDQITCPESHKTLKPASHWFNKKVFLLPCDHLCIWESASFLLSCWETEYWQEGILSFQQLVQVEPPLLGGVETT